MCVHPLSWAPTSPLRVYTLGELHHAYRGSVCCWQPQFLSWAGQACGQRPLIESPEFGWHRLEAFLLVAVGDGLVMACLGPQVRVTRLAEGPPPASFLPGLVWLLGNPWHGAEARASASPAALASSRLASRPGMKSVLLLRVGAATRGGSSEGSPGDAAAVGRRLVAWRLWARMPVLVIAMLARLTLEASGCPRHSPLAPAPCS